MKRVILPLVTAWAVSCGPKTLQARLSHGEKQATRAEALLDEAEVAMAQLEPDSASEKLARAKAALADPDVGYYPERELVAKRIAADEAKLPQVRRDREKQEIQKVTGERERDIDAANTEMRAALEELQTKELSASSVGRLRKAVSQLKANLEAGRRLEAKDSDYSKYVQGIERGLREAQAKLTLSANTLAFLEGPGGDYAKANSCIRAAKGQRKSKRRQLYGEAESKFRSCALAGRELIVTTRGLARASIAVDGAPTSPAALTARCSRQARSMNQLVAALSRPSLKNASAQRLKK